MSPRRARRLPDVMPRKPRGGLPRRQPGAGDADGEEAALGRGPERTETGPDGAEWAVRPMPGDATVKTYRCPGCDQEIAPGTAHVVAWPAQGAGPAGRRHWHSPCWERRLTRPAPRRRPGR